MLEIRCIFQRGDSADDGQAVERVGVEAVLDPFQCLDQRRVADGEADAQSGQRARFGKRVHDQQVVVAVGQRNGRFPAEIDIGFIDDDDRVPICRKDLLDGVDAELASCRRVGVGEDDAAVGLRVIGRVDREVVGQRHGAVVDAVQRAIDRVEAVGDVREEDRPRRA